jgi:hypothetical protein
MKETSGESVSACLDFNDEVSIFFAGSSCGVQKHFPPSEAAHAQHDHDQMNSCATASICSYRMHMWSPLPTFCGHSARRSIREAATEYLLRADDGETAAQTASRRVLIFTIARLCAHCLGFRAFRFKVLKVCYSQFEYA